MSLQSRIDEALFRQLLSGARIPLIGSAFGGLLITLSQLGSAKGHLFVLWCLVVYLVIGIRVFFLRRCQKQLAKKGFHHALAYRYCLTLALSGFAWGALGWLVVDASPLTVIMVVTAIQAMVMGGVVTMASFTPAFFAFSLPAMLPIVLVFSFSENLTSFIMAVFSVIFYILMIGVIYRFNQSLRQATRIGFENEDLIGSLKDAYHQISIQNQELNHLAHHDTLTGLPNRKLLSLRLQQAIELGQLKKTTTALLYLDLDGFKAVNDQWGHDAGDLALVEVAARLSQVIRGGDTLARVGGDEFVIVLSDLPEQANAAVEIVAQKCLMAFELPFQIRDAVCPLGTSIGLTLCQSGETIAQTLAAADKAMYQAKLLGCGQICWAP
ncbi:GGDEF domain-containing protein [Methylophilus medardicus]|uniref:GGDEF domain-containing protein n=1 Tax=Methylophilus medardicus TaxID=2588534 RepID=A0A5B8CQM8_9PROT|nr:GGDEF domain-containing protein [Methylophilus medardicus]QDC43517.1 GGDEF domain-containing protein [Methylophilus medardicus]QDC48524.1 GGDEF domain-containing protein [Methylophilus medardicus]QDC52229.1 GGDEF domain-containing protein [Methylophilus medardicus]